MALTHDTSTPAIEITNRILDQLSLDLVKEIYAGQWAELETARGVYELGAALHPKFKEEVESDSKETRCRDKVFGDRGNLRFLLGLDDEGKLIARPKGGPRIAEVCIPNNLNSKGSRLTTKSLVRLYAMGKIDLETVQSTVYAKLESKLIETLRDISAGEVKIQQVIEGAIHHSLFTDEQLTTMMVGYIGNLGNHNTQQLDAFLPNWPQIVRAAVPRALHTAEYQALEAAATTIEKRVARVGWTTLLMLCDRLLEMEMSTSSRISLMTSTLPLDMDKAQAQFSQMVAEEIEENPETITVSLHKGEREDASLLYMSRRNGLERFIRSSYLDRNLFGSLEEIKHVDPRIAVRPGSVWLSIGVGTHELLMPSFDPTPYALFSHTGIILTKDAPEHTFKLRSFDGWGSRPGNTYDNHHSYSEARYFKETAGKFRPAKMIFDALQDSDYDFGLHFFQVVPTVRNDRYKQDKSVVVNVRHDMQAALDRTLDLIQDNWELLNKASREDDFAFDVDKFKAFRERCVIQVIGVGYMPKGELTEFQIPGPVFKR